MCFILYIKTIKEFQKQEKIFLNEFKQIEVKEVKDFKSKEIRKEVLSNNISFWLDWKKDTLINRIKRNNKRPIVNNSDENELKKLISKRIKIYSMAYFKKDCEKFSKKEITKKIVDIYEKN